MNKGLSAGVLKLIAIAAMTIDHAAWVFVPHAGILPLTMHIIGRVTFPVMAFLAAEGYRHTRNLGGYMLRLLIFAAASSLPFYLVFGSPFNVLFTLAAGLLAIYIRENIKENFAAHLLIFLLAVMASFCDWGFVGVYMVFLFHRLRDKKWGNAAAVGAGCFVLMAMQIPDFLRFGFDIYTSMNLMHLGMLLSLPLIYAYGGRRGVKLKYFFYTFYPLHLLVLYGLNIWL
ncbi:MAG TPA: hypothetical protein DEQ02_08350 [Ruminococcaceae bacterium]|nr:hypothetical protein [Oscillospiraceae bacterium]